MKGDHVGSLLRTEPIKRARAACAKGEIHKATLKEVEDQEIEKLVQMSIYSGTIWLIDSFHLLET
ncbi:hypothetical protein [Lederbergia ruris]|uniref:hypothetical protein n=1 Tax=Lederbergia ruris TaxID=217495 RepID=UPI00399F5B24